MIYNIWRGSNCIPSAFNINQALKQLVILATSLSLREYGSMREKNHTPQSTMMLLNCVDCMVSKYLPLSKFKWFREHSHLPSFLSGIYNFPAVMRIVTWLPIFVSREALYYETGWETLKTRRYVAKMTNMFKIHTGGVPEYLLNIVPKKREHVSSYNTRNKEDYIIPRCRLQLFRNSFIPDAVKQWNLLKVEVREVISISSFRKNLETKVKSPPSFFSFGKRYTNIIHTKLRHDHWRI